MDDAQNEQGIAEGGEQGLFQTPETFHSSSPLSQKKTMEEAMRLKSCPANVCGGTR